MYKTKDRKGAVTVIDSGGKTLKIPIWMTEEDASNYHISKDAEIDIETLLKLNDFIEKLKEHDNP